MTRRFRGLTAIFYSIGACHTNPAGTGLHSGRCLYNRDTGPMTPQQLIFLAIVAVTLILFISERVRIDIAAMMTLLALAFTGILTPAEALSGFASEPAIIVAAVFVISCRAEAQPG